MSSYEKWKYKSMIQKLIESCKKIEKKWKKDTFPDFAFKTLYDLSFNLNIEEFEIQIGDWINKKNLPTQLNLYNNFGEPSLTIFNNGKFALDVYFWRKNDTIIHSHGFRGAFKILYGLSLHEEFTVKTKETYGDDVKKVEIKTKNTKIMKPGEVQQINPGKELIHSVVHLTNPTVSLCIRTVEDTDLSQWHHLSTGLSYKKNHISEKTIKKTLYFQYLKDSDIKRAQEFFKKILNELNDSSKISLYESICFDQLGLSNEASEICLDILHHYFKGTKWFQLYQTHYENLQKNLQESQAQSSELKFLSHAINKNFDKKKIESLLVQFSKNSVLELCDELINEEGVFTQDFKDLQFHKIKKYITNQCNK